MSRRAAPIFLAASLAGCAGSMTSVAPLPPPAFTELGKTSGSACGFLLFDLFPIGVNDRTGRAYARAVDHVSASSLTDTTVEQTWQYGVVGTLLCTEVSGTGVQASSGEPPTPLPESRGEMQKRLPETDGEPAPVEAPPPLEGTPEGEPLGEMEGEAAPDFAPAEPTEDVPRSEPLEDVDPAEEADPADE
jgi:hypothetical protein